MTGRRLFFFDEVVPDPVELEPRPVDEVARAFAEFAEQVRAGQEIADLEARRAKWVWDQIRAEPPVTTVVTGPLHTPLSVPNDMRPREVDRKKIKAERKRAARNRRKRK